LADVFLSYARGDRALAERLAHAIGKAGLTVWWDRHIKGGSEFSRDIERQLEAASRVLVLWSKEAVASRWVRDEASVAADTGRLVSATIDGTPPPLGFRQFQTIDLKGWNSKGALIPRALAEALEIDAPARARPPESSRRRGRLFAAGAAVLLVAGVATIAIVQPAPFDEIFSGEEHSDDLALAIMPFVTQSGAGIDYLGAGLSSALADSLAPLSGLKITASTSTQAVAQQHLTAPDIAKKLGISHLVEGDVQKQGDRVAVSIRLIDARTSEQLWTRSFEGAADQLQLLKGQMARELAGALGARLGVGSGEIADRGNVDPRAYEAYLRALERVSVRDDDDARTEAIKQFRLAASIQPDFADAHAGYAYLLSLSVPYQLGMSWGELIAEQHRATERALQLDGRNDLALVAKATALQNFDGIVDQSIAIDEAVLARSPNFGPAHYSLAAGLFMAGRGRDALDHIDQAIDRDPFDSLLGFYRTKILDSLGDYEAVRSAISACGEDCGRMTFEWFVTLVGFASPDQYRDDFPQLEKLARASGVPAQDLREGRAIAEGLIFGRPAAIRRLQNPRDMDFINAAIAARLISFDEGLRYARVAADNLQPDSVIDILNEGRVTFTPEQRADPRYHQLFRHPKLIRLAAERRKNGVTAGLPVFPVKPYTGR
jgi:TolB-like protein